MIPDVVQCKLLWEKYQLPPEKRKHCELVAKVAGKLAKSVKASLCQSINTELLTAAALLHDIDKNIPKLPGQLHPDIGVRILKEEGMEEVADLVEIHPLHLILDFETAPKTWEEKLLFLADKMVKYEVIGVDARFRLWNEEHMGGEAQRIVTASYPKVKELEKEVCNAIGITTGKLIDNGF